MKLATAADMPSFGPFQQFRIRVTERVFGSLRFAGGFGVLSFQVFRELLRPPYYPGLIVEQLVAIGTESVYLVLVTGLATGSVMALQFGYGLARFGGTLYVPKVVALTVLREMGPVFTSLLVAGRIGSGIAAEVGSMKVTQQIDAIRALGTNPTKRIVIPRLLACLIALPVLTLMADYIGVLGAMMVSSVELHINTAFFTAKVLQSLTMPDLLTGLAKTVVFAYFIAITACWKGLNTEGGTEGVGKSTTWVVVTTSIFIMVADFFLSKFFILTVLPG